MNLQAQTQSTRAGAAAPTPGAGAPVDLGLQWEHGFAALGRDFFTPLQPTPLPAVHWVGRSADVARLIGLDAARLHDDAALQVFSGNAPLAGALPLASVYSGHQFGVWAGQLGDGRAILLGQTAGGWELQLKGAGRTPYARMGDGRAVLRSSVREFLCSQAMQGLGIPTTLALCITGSPQPVQREQTETAAVVTRVARSFVRFGHFEHFAASGQTRQLQALADHLIERHYPECQQGDPAARSSALLQAIAGRSASLLAHWQAVGFCHGVMNTDNMSALGLTIDYGPFQFLDAFVPGHVCNHSDHQGRYAYARQPQVAYWNLLCLAQALLPLIGDVERARAALASWPDAFQAELLARMRAKLGLPDARAGDAQLVDSALQLLARERVDYSIFWRRLAQSVATGDQRPLRALFSDPAALDSWLLSFAQRSAQIPAARQADLMLSTNPKFVLRNHLAEQAIRAAQRGDFSPVETLQRLLAHPFDEHPGYEQYAALPPDWAASIEVSCSS